MNELPLIDMIVGSVILLAVIRGIWIGMIREGLSLAAIAVATLVTRLFVHPLASSLTDLTGGDITGKTAVWIAGVLLVVATVLLLGFAARLLKRSAEYAGLGWADRVGGGALGAAEGAIVAAVIVLITLWLVGPDHAATDGARSVEVVEQLQAMREDGQLPAVAAPGEWF